MTRLVVLNLNDILGVVAQHAMIYWEQEQEGAKSAPLKQYLVIMIVFAMDKLADHVRTSAIPDI